MIPVDAFKKQFFRKIEQDLKQQNFIIDRKDDNRPWGGFFVIDEHQAIDFIHFFFDKIHADELQISGKLSPKLLLVAPKRRLSWQYHYRRAEIWKIMEGTLAVATSETDEEGAMQIVYPGTIIKLKQRERHRLIGLDEWGLVAEIWQHTDSEHLSDEDDIIRIQDDFGRS